MLYLMGSLDYLQIIYIKLWHKKVIYCTILKCQWLRKSFIYWFILNCVSRSTLTSLWAMSTWWRYSMAVPMSCIISDASEWIKTGPRMKRTCETTRKPWLTLLGCLWPTPLREGLVASVLNTAEQLPSLHTARGVHKEIRTRTARGFLANNQFSTANLRLTTKLVLFPGNVLFYSSEPWMCQVSW